MGKRRVTKNGRDRGVDQLSLNEQNAKRLQEERLQEERLQEKRLQSSATVNCLARFGSVEMLLPHHATDSCPRRPPSDAIPSVQAEEVALRCAAPAQHVENIRRKTSDGLLFAPLRNNAHADYVIFWETV